MTQSKPDNSGRNTRILELARQGKAQAEIARELGISRGVVGGVVRRARDAGALPSTEPAQATEHRPETLPQAAGQGEEE